MSRLRLRHQLLCLGALGVMAAGTLACLLTGRTQAHVLSIWLMTVFAAGTVFLTDRYLPCEQPGRVRLWTAALSLAAVGWIVLFHLWSYTTAEYIYIFDYSLYYYQQLQLADTMNEGLTETLALVGRSIGTDYTYVPNLLLAPLFSLTDRSIQAHGLCGVVLTWGLLAYQLRRASHVLAKRLDFTPARTVLLHAGMMLICCALPVLHRATSWCQVNLLGLPVFVLIVLLSWNCDFRRPEKLRLTALFASVLLLVLMRRWFIYLLAGYLLLWGGRTVIGQLRARDFAALRNLAGYALVCVCLGLLLLWPLFAHAIGGNYAETYSYWKGGGLLFELKNQTWLTGLGTMILTGCGYLWGMLQRKSRGLRAFSCVMAFTGVIALVGFNLIQSMNDHQVTILMPTYVVGLALLFAAGLSLSRTWLRSVVCGVLSAALLFQYGVCLTSERPQDISALLPHDTLVPPVREDFDAIHTVSDFVSDNCTAAEQALFLCNSDLYDRLTFVNLRYPDLTMRDKVALQRIAIPTDGFPTAWFSARYYIVPSVPQTNTPGGTAEKLTRYLLDGGAANFRTVMTVDFGDFDMYVMERTAPAEWNEVAALLDLFAEESEAWPKLYKDRIGWYWQQQ